MTDLDPIIHAAVRALHRGEVIGVPTDTVYGLACDPRSVASIERLFAVKGRQADHPVAVLAASLDDAAEIGAFDGHATAAARSHWPGALTAVVRMITPLAPGVGDGARRTIGLRVPDHPLALRLLAAAGPLAVTSANRSGEAPALDDEEANLHLGDAVSVYLPGRCPGESPSTVVDFTVDPPIVLRQGPVAL